jgi:RND family efflux transporter MFP subunit
MNYPHFKHVLAASLLALTWQTATFAADVEGFTEPFRTINVAAGETGILETILVAEGDKVTKGQEVACLTLDVQQASQEVAERMMNAVGQLNTANAELKLKSNLLSKLEALRLKGHASQEEVDRIAIEKEVSEARLLAVTEELLLKKIEHKRLGLQIERRRVRSPIDGVVARMWKDEAEFVAPNEPVVATIVQLDPLLAVFAVPSILHAGLKTGDVVPVSFGEQAVDGKIELISPITDAQSGTIAIKVRLANPQGKLRSGERCRLTIHEQEPSLTEQPRPTRR